MCNDGNDATCAGSPFQTRAAETGKDGDADADGV